MLLLRCKLGVLEACLFTINNANQYHTQNETYSYILLASLSYITYYCFTFTVFFAFVSLVAGCDCVFDTSVCGVSLLQQRDGAGRPASQTHHSSHVPADAVASWRCHVAHLRATRLRQSLLLVVSTTMSALSTSFAENFFVIWCYFAVIH